MATYYVDDATGNDTNDGSVGSPWKTIPYTWSAPRGGNTVAEGDTVLFMDGDYGLFREKVGDDGHTVVHRTNWVTYQNVTGQDAVVFNGIVIQEDNGSDPNDADESDGISYLKFIGIDVTSSVTILRSSYVYFEDCDVSNVSSALEGFHAPYFSVADGGVVTTSVKFLTLLNCTIKDCYRGVSSEKTGDGVAPSDINITGCTIYNIGEDGIVVTSSNVAIVDNYIHTMRYKSVPVNMYSSVDHGSPIEVGDAVTQDLSGATGVVANYPARAGFDIAGIWQTSETNFAHSHFDLQSSDAGTKTFQMKEGIGDQTALFTNGDEFAATDFNIVTGNNADVYTVNSSAWDGTHTTVVVDEVISDAGVEGRVHYGPKIVADVGGNVFGPIINEDPEHSDLITLGHGGSGFVVTNNVLIRNMPGDEDGQVVKFDSCQNITLENNLMVGARCLLLEGMSGFDMINNTMYGTSAQAAIRMFTSATAERDTVIDNMYNNIIVTQGDNSMNIDADNAVETEIVNFGSNIYSVAPEGLGGPANVFTYDSVTSNNYGAGFDDLFVDSDNATVADRDYSLAGDSFALNFGNTSKAPEFDILGVTRGNPPDAGAYDDGIPAASSGGIRSRYTGSSAFRLLRDRYSLSS